MRTRASIEADWRMGRRKAKAIAKAKTKLAIRRCALHSVQHSPADGSSDLGDAESFGFPTRLEAQEQMLKKGWFIHQVRHVARKYDRAALHLLAGLERSPLRTVNHQRCLDSRSCVAFNTDEKTYKTQHTTEHCACATIVVPYASLLEIVRSGRVPLISIEKRSPREAEQFQIRVKPRIRNSKHIAISHVWTDGLGNPTVNGLPACQIERIERSLSALQKGQDDSLFWMDTLCVPVGPDERIYRNAQIDNMASIYKGASCSLILDAELMHLSYGHSRQDVHALLASSVWMTRSWPIQEGKLPSNIAVQFSDSIIVLGRASAEDGRYTKRQISLSGRETHANTDTGENTMSDNTIAPLLIDADIDTRESLLAPTVAQAQCDCGSIALEKAFFNTFFDEDHSSNPTQRFTSVWDELSGRSTTKANDVPMIITNMLNMSNHGLLDLHETNEMFQTILLSLKQVPVSIFFNTGPRQDPHAHHRNRWVPTEIGSPDLSKIEMTANARDDFIELQYPCRDQDRDVLIYTIATVIPLKTEIRLSLDSGREVYTVKPQVDVEDAFVFDDYAATCIIFERTSVKDRPRKGACFYIHSQNKTNDSWPGIFTRSYLALQLLRNEQRAQCAAVEMTYYCPLELREVDARPLIELEQIPPTYQFRHLNTRTKLRIKYDPLPNFERLSIRSQYGYRGYLQAAFIATSFGLIYAVAFLFAGLGRLMQLIPVPELLQDATRLLGFIFSVVFFLAFKTAFEVIIRVEPFADTANRLEEWHHVRSYEVRRRVNRDAV